MWIATRRLNWMGKARIRHAMHPGLLQGQLYAIQGAASETSLALFVALTELGCTRLETRRVLGACCCENRAARPEDLVPRGPGLCAAQHPGTQCGGTASAQKHVCAHRTAWNAAAGSCRRLLCDATLFRCRYIAETLGRSPQVGLRARGMNLASLVGCSFNLLFPARDACVRPHDLAPRLSEAVW